MSILLERLGLDWMLASSHNFNNAVIVGAQDMPLLQAVWDRRSFRFTEDEFKGRTRAVRDLEEVWSKIKWSNWSAAMQKAGSTTREREEEPEQKSKKPATECWSQQDSVFVGGDPFIATLQPNNFLSVHEFTLDDARSPSNKEDTWLLQMVGVLESLREQANISAVLDGGQYVPAERLKTDDEWAEEGRRVLEKHETVISKRFDPDWSKRVGIAQL